MRLGRARPRKAARGGATTGHHSPARPARCAYREELRQVASKAGRGWVTPAATTEQGTEQVGQRWAGVGAAARLVFAASLPRLAHQRTYPLHLSPQLYSALERQIQQPAFAEELARSQHDLQQQQRRQPDGAAAAAADGKEVLSQDWWELRDDGELRGKLACGTHASCWLNDCRCRLTCSNPDPPLHARLPLPNRPLLQSASRRGSMCWWSEMTWCEHCPPS